MDYMPPNHYQMSYLERFWLQISWPLHTMPHACYHHFTCGSMKIFKNCLTQNIFHFHDYPKGVLATETPKIHLFRDKRKNIPNPFPPFNFKTFKFKEKEHQTIKRLSTVNDCNNKKLYRMKHLKKSKNHSWTNIQERKNCYWFTCNLMGAVV